MNFDDYISATGILILNVIIRDNSNISIDSALSIVRDRVNRKATEFTDVDVKASLSDFRNGNIYEIFSDLWLDKYNQTSWWNLQLDNVSIQALLNSNTTSGALSGYTKDIIVDSELGIVDITVDNPDNKGFNVFTKMETDEEIKLLLTNEELTSFRLELIDTSTFEELHRDCSTSPISINYVVVFK